jgi:hypothetical protein
MIPVKIKPDKYGNAIGLLIRLGGGFQTRRENTLIVTREQLRILEEVGFVETSPSEKEESEARGQAKT